VPESDRNVTSRLHERRLVLSFPDLPAEFDGLRICHFSDLHIRRPGPLYDELVDYLRARTFDLGCCTGDIGYSTGTHLRRMLGVMRAVLAAARPRLGWFLVRGNNDSRPLLRRLEEEGAYYLVNRSMRLGRSDVLYVVGVDDPHYEHDDLDAALVDVPEGAFKLLLAHSPDIIDKAQRRGVRLVLCGHTHGGQIRLPLAGALITQTRVGRRYAWGLKRKRGTLIFTTSGVGFTFIPVRINCPSEVANITLRRGDAPPVDSGPTPI
jgi:hypothetical protein